MITSFGGRLQLMFCWAGQGFNFWCPCLDGPYLDGILQVLISPSPLGLLLLFLWWYFIDRWKDLTCILSVGHGKSLGANLPIFFIIICMDSHLKGKNSRWYSCNWNCWKGVAAIPSTVYNFYNLQFFQSTEYDLEKPPSRMCREYHPFGQKEREEEETQTSWT